LKEADLEWLKTGLRESYSVIDSLMNQKETKIGRRNQVLYCLGKCQAHFFTSEIIEKIIRSEFPGSTMDISLAISTILTDLSKRSPSIIKRGNKASTYEFTDPRYIMCLRLMLRKSNEGERIQKFGFEI
jgi:hypothetical protein